jgi:hypothetical protein
MKTKMTAFWDMAPCSHVQGDWGLRGAYCLHHERDRPDDGGAGSKPARVHPEMENIQFIRGTETVELKFSSTEKGMKNS